MAEDFNLDEEPIEETGLEKPEEKKYPTPLLIESFTKKRVGRPTGYNQEIVDFICNEIKTTIDGMRKICQRSGVDYSTVRVWLDKYPEFQAQYIRAKQCQADNIAEEIFEVLDEDIKENDMAAVQSQRTKVDAYKWMAGKLLPKVYGDKQQVEHTVDTTQPMTEEQFKIFMAAQFQQTQQAQLSQGERNGNIESADIVG